MFKGTGTAVITPLKKDLTIDFESFKKVIDYQINNGVDAVVILGTTGEAPVITDEERAEVVEFTVKYVNGRAKVIVGTGSNDPKHVLEHNNCAKKYGADGLLIVNPYYNKGTQRSLVEYYKFLDEKTDLPIILYNVPSRTGMNMLPETVVKIYENCKNVVAVKEASGDISQIAKLLAIKPEGLSVLSGNDDQTLPIIALGGDGVISAWGNAFPKEMVSLTNAMLAGNLKEAQKLQNNYCKLMQLIFLETSPTPIKFLMYKLGLCENTIRLPLTTAAPETEDALLAEFATYKVKDILLSKI